MSPAKGGAERGVSELPVFAVVFPNKVPLVARLCAAHASWLRENKAFAALGGRVLLVHSQTVRRNLRGGCPECASGEGRRTTLRWGKVPSGLLRGEVEPDGGES